MTLSTDTLKKKLARVTEERNELRRKVKKSNSLQMKLEKARKERDDLRLKVKEILLPIVHAAISYRHHELLFTNDAPRYRDELFDAVDLRRCLELNPCGSNIQKLYNLFDTRLPDHRCVLVADHDGDHVFVDDVLRQSFIAGLKR